MDDSSSTASFEEIGPSNNPFGKGFDPTEEDKNVEKLKALIAKSAANAGAPRELDEDETPEICYVLQYKGWGGKPIDCKLPRHLRG